MWTIPFGLAVVPDVYIRKSTSSASITSQEHAASEMQTSCHQWSRPAVIGVSPLVRLSTTHPCTGASAIASSAIPLSGTVVPRRQASSWVIRNSHPMSSIREESESAENPPKTTVCGAPSRAQASIATGNSGTMPM